MYFANIKIDGPVKYGVLPGQFLVLDSPKSFMPIGEATEISWTDKGLATWMLTVHGKELPGRWVIIDREFRPVQ